MADRPIAAAIRQLVDSAANGLGALPASPFTDFLQGGLLLMRRSLFPNDPGGQVATPAAPTITVHNGGPNTIWMYNLTTSNDNSIPATPWSTDPAAPPDWLGPVSIAPGSSAPVTLALFNAAPGQDGNRIYFVEDPGFPTIPADPVNAFYPFPGPGGGGNSGCGGGPTGNTNAACNSFKNYSFLEYDLYPATTGSGNWYTIDVSYIDEWSLPIQTKFTIPTGSNGSPIWNGAVDAKWYGFANFDTVKSQLDAAGQPYSDLVWSGPTPSGPQPLGTVRRIIGPNKVWSQQSAYQPCDVGKPSCNFGMNKPTTWVPRSYTDFVLYGDSPQSLVYPYSWSGTQVAKLVGSNQTNWDFWENSVSGPASTPYPMALHTAAVLDGFNANGAGGIWGFFTYPNDNKAGQFTNIPTSVSLDICVGSTTKGSTCGGVPLSDGAGGSVIAGGIWRYSSSVAPTGRSWVKTTSAALTGTAATDTFIMNYAFKNPRVAPLVLAGGADRDLVGIDKGSLGATSTSVDVVDRACFLFSFTQSQFVYETSTGNLYYDKYPLLPGYTGVLGNLSASSLDPSSSVFVL